MIKLLKNDDVYQEISSRSFHARCTARQRTRSHPTPLISSQANLKHARVRDTKKCKRKGKRINWNITLTPFHVYQHRIIMSQWLIFSSNFESVFKVSIESSWLYLTLDLYKFLSFYCLVSHRVWWENFLYMSLFNETQFNE